MRRSSRIHEKVQPRLPVEVQLAIARQAGLVLYAAGKPADKQQMTQLCLVSPSWRSEIQSMMFHSVQVRNAVGRILSPHLRPRSSIGQHIREIDFGRDSSESAAIIKRLRLLPALSGIKGLFWTDEVAAIKPPARSARPAVDALSLSEATPATAAQLGEFFDLSALRGFGLVRPYYWPSTFDATLLATVPSGIRALELQHVRFQDIAAVPDVIARFVDLTNLTLVSIGAGDALSIRLPTFPRLLDLTVSLKSTPHALETGQASLRRLILERRSDDWGVIQALNLVEQVRDACRILTTTSAGRFPSLRTIAMTSDWRPGMRKLAFSGDSPYNPRLLLHADLAGLSQALSAAGLRLVDEEDVEWRAEWEQATAAGHA